MLLPSPSLPSATVVARPPLTEVSVELPPSDFAFEFFVGVPHPPNDLHDTDFTSPFTYELVTQHLLEKDDYTNPPSAATVPSRFYLLRIWAVGAIISKCDSFWPLFHALRTNKPFNFDLVLTRFGPQDFELILLRCLAFQPYGPAFILDWLLLFQSTIEQLVVRDKKQKYFHPQRWQWFGHAHTYANLKVKGSDPAVDVPRPQSPTATKRGYDHKARFGLKDRSAEAFLKAFGFPVSELQNYVRCPPNTPSSWSYAHNTYAQVRHPKRGRRWALPASLAQLPEESNMFDNQDDYDCFEVLHWYAYYVVTALKDLAALWPTADSTPPALTPSAAADGYMLDGTTYDPKYESELDTDNDDLWSSAHDSDIESTKYSFNDHLGYEEKTFELSDLLAIKREDSPAPPVSQDPVIDEPNLSTRVRTPFSTPPLHLRLSGTALRALAKAVPFHQDAALITGGASLLSMRSSEGLISPPRGMVTFTDSYCHRRDVFGPPVPQPRRFTAEEKGKGKATFEPPPAPVAETVLPTPAKIDNAAAAVQLPAEA
ncbi:hypothetical protein MPER_12834 [Moniliophthora perniciosa FA553]|nr:hypothetical protein MPER_12834 [Moniliophthora perniciosa FA553]